jgi:hypothetical protein
MLHFKSVLSHCDIVFMSAIQQDTKESEGELRKDEFQAVIKIQNCLR